VRQLHERLEAFEVRHGVVAAPLPELLNYSATVQIASVDTLHRRAIVHERIPLPAADVVIFDEGHLATAETRLRILQSYPDAIRIGFTATPARKSGRSLGAAFDSLIQGPSIRELTAAARSRRYGSSIPPS
jgi:superfamily II DNA or RNA helicase